MQKHTELFLPKTKTGAKVGILGGSFDPPHLSHQLLALSALSLEGLDQLWIIPCADHPDRTKSMSPFEHRLKLCELAFSHFGTSLQVLAIEENMPRPNFTVRTLEAIASAKPDLKLSLILGSDILNDLHNWQEPEKLEDLCEVVVFLRDGFALPKVPSILKKPRIHAGFFLPNIQSHFVRADLAKTKDLLDQKVAEYIQTQGLYNFPLS